MGVYHQIWGGVLQIFPETNPVTGGVRIGIPMKHIETLGQGLQYWMFTTYQLAQDFATTRG